MQAYFTCPLLHHSWLECQPSSHSKTVQRLQMMASQAIITDYLGVGHMLAKELDLLDY